MGNVGEWVTSIIFAFILIVLVFAPVAWFTSQAYDREKHGIQSREIELQLTNGKVVTLVCPVFESKPAGAHGRECYIKAEQED